MNRILAFASFVLLLGFLGACRREKRPPLPTPTIFQIDQLLLRAGDTLTITGEAFSPTAAANQVLFNGVAGRPLSGNLRTIRVIVPDGAGSGTLQVIRDGRASNRFPYEYEGRLEIEEEVIFEGSVSEGFRASRFLIQANGDIYVGFSKVEEQSLPVPPFFEYNTDIKINRYTLGNSTPTDFFTASFSGPNFDGLQAMYITDNGYQVYHYNNRYHARVQATGAATQLSGLELPTEQLFADANQNVYTTIFSSNAQQTLVVRIPNGTTSSFNAEENIIAVLPFDGFCFPRSLSAIDEAGNIYMYTLDPCSSGGGSIHRVSSPGATPVLLTNSLPLDVASSESMFYLASRRSLLLYDDNGVVHLYNLEQNTYERYQIEVFDFSSNFEPSQIEMDKDGNLLILLVDKSGSGIIQIRRLRIR